MLDKIPDIAVSRQASCSRTRSAVGTKSFAKLPISKYQIPKALHRLRER